MPTVSIRGNSNTYKINNGEKLFHAIKDAGHELMHGCLAGSCGACRIEVHNGAKHLSPISEQESSTLKMIEQNYKRIHGPGSLDGKVIRLSCMAKFISDGELEISELT